MEKIKKIKNKPLTSENLYDMMPISSFKTWLNEMPKFRSSSNGLSVSTVRPSNWQDDEFNIKKPKYVYTQIETKNIKKIVLDHDNNVDNLISNGIEYIPIRTIGIADDDYTIKGSSTGKAIFVPRVEEGPELTYQNRFWIPLFIAKRFFDTINNHFYICVPKKWIMDNNYQSYFPKLRNQNTTPIISSTLSTNDIKEINETDLPNYIPLFKVFSDDELQLTGPSGNVISVTEGTALKDVNTQISTFGSGNIQTIRLPKPMYIPVKFLVKYERPIFDIYGRKDTEWWIMVKSFVIEKSAHSSYFRKTF